MAATVTMSGGESQRATLMVLRLSTLVALVALLTAHARSVRVFRWEQSVSGGLLITYCLVSVGLCLCAAVDKCGGRILQAFFCAVGSALFAINTATLWRRWRYASALTRAVAELLQTLGIHLQRQVLWKVWLSLLIALALIADLVVSLLMTH